MIAARQRRVGSGRDLLDPPAAPGEWQPTVGCPATGGQFLHWSKVTPFALLSADQFRLDPPPALGSATYTRDYNEVRTVGGLTSAERPHDRTDVSRLYAVSTPNYVFNPVARSAGQGKSLSENARALALLNTAISDAAVATFDSKYAPLIATPYFPSYPSAHATLSTAGREMVERIYSTGPYSIQLPCRTRPSQACPSTTQRSIRSSRMSMTRATSAGFTSASTSTRAPRWGGRSPCMSSGTNCAPRARAVAGTTTGTCVPRHGPVVGRAT